MELGAGPRSSNFGCSRWIGARASQRLSMAHHNGGSRSEAPPRTDAGARAEALKFSIQVSNATERSPRLGSDFRSNRCGRAESSTKYMRSPPRPNAPARGRHSEPRRLRRGCVQVRVLRLRRDPGSSCGRSFPRVRWSARPQRPSSIGESCNFHGPRRCRVALRQANPSGRLV
jgi:hypothetical protein